LIEFNSNIGQLVLLGMANMREQIYVYT
jgi:hypothetical protein